MIFYAIQNVITGNFLPAGGRKLGSHTEQEPTSSRPPRLFIKRTSAERAMSCYMKGVWRQYNYSSYTGEFDSSGIKPMKGTARKYAMLVVQVELKETRK